MKRYHIQVALLPFVVTMIACESAEQKAKRVDSEMVAEAKRAAVEESTFVSDSVKFDSTFTTMAVDSAKMLNTTELDGNGGSDLVTRYFAYSGAKVCQLSKEKFPTVAPKDTIHCQWADKVDQ